MEGRFTYFIRFGGAALCNRTIEEPILKEKIESYFGPLKIDKPIKLTTTSPSVIVWATGAGDGALLSKPDEANMLLKTAPWVVVVRLKLQKEK